MLNSSISDEVNRQSSAIVKRREQIHRWNQSETNRQSTNIKESQRVKFEQAYIFLAACSSDDRDEIDQLLEHGVDINTSNIDGLTALHQSCIDNNLSMIEYLLRKHADINCQDNEGWTPLHAAASCGNFDIVKYLLSQGARVEICNNEGELPIDIAEGDEIVALLDEDMRRKGIDDQQARNCEHQLMIKHAQDLIQTKISPDSVVHLRTGATALHVAAAKGYLDVIELLIRAGANVNSIDNDGWTPLHAAAHWDKHEIIKYLIEKHADLDAKNDAGQTPFDVCDGETFELLKQFKAKQSEVKTFRWGTVGGDIPYVRRRSETISAEEAEAQRKHRSAQARRERRSTQSVTIEDIKAAEQQIQNDSNKRIGAPSISNEHDIETEHLQTMIENQFRNKLANDSLNLVVNRLQKKTTGKIFWNDETKEVEIVDKQKTLTINDEQTKRNIEELNQKIQRLERDLRQRDEIIEKFKTSQFIESSFDKREKRSYERKISELEEDLKRIDSIKADNTRLKEENAALIRVISKLSK